METAPSNGWLTESAIKTRSDVQVVGDRLREYIDEAAQAHYALGAAADLWCSLVEEQRVQSWLRSPRDRREGEPRGIGSPGVRHVITDVYLGRTIGLPDGNDDDQMITAQPSPGDRDTRGRGLSPIGPMLSRRIAQDPHWLFMRGMFGVTLLLAAAAACMALKPVVGLLVLLVALVCWGLVILVDSAIRGESKHDTRLATLVLLSGLGTLVVALVQRMMR